MRTALLAMLVGLALAGPSAETILGAAASPAGQHSAELSLQQPVLPQSSTLAGVTIILILGLFLAAVVIGPIVRANLPEEIPVTHSHDEPPGASHHHGASGTH